VQKERTHGVASCWPHGKDMEQNLGDENQGNRAKATKEQRASNAKLHAQYAQKLLRRPAGV